MLENLTRELQSTLLLLLLICNQSCCCCVEVATHCNITVLQTQEMLSRITALRQIHRRTRTRTRNFLSS